MVFLSFKWLAISLFSFLHPFYVSVTEIHHNSNTKSLEISCKVFVDDMEKILTQTYKTTVDLSDVKQQASNDKLMFEYFSKHLSVKPDGKTAKLQYVGYEKDSESVYCYLEVTGVPTVKKLEISNSILHDLTSDQINIMHVIVNGKRQSYKLDFPKKQMSFNF